MAFPPSHRPGPVRPVRTSLHASPGRCTMAGDLAAESWRFRLDGNLRPAFGPHGGPLLRQVPLRVGPLAVGGDRQEMVPLVPPGPRAGRARTRRHPLATVLSAATGCRPSSSARRPRNTGPSACGRRRHRGKGLVVIEDVVTTGGQILLSAQDLRSEGATVGHALCVIDREAGAQRLLRRGSSSGTSSPCPTSSRPERRPSRSSATSTFPITVTGRFVGQLC